MLTKDRAICLRVADYSETSQVVTLFARLSGKVRAIAKGSKRPKSAFDGPVEVLSLGEIVFSSSHKDRLVTLTEFSQQPGSGGLRRNLFALHCALFAAQLLDVMTDELDPHLVLFDQFSQFIQDMDRQDATSERHSVAARLILLQLVVLREVGLYPVFKSCANCKRSFSPDWRDCYFSSSANGLICRDCEMSYPDKVRLHVRAAACLADWKQLAQADERTVREVEGVLTHHFTEILGRRLKTADYVQRGLT